MADRAAMTYGPPVATSAIIGAVMILFALIMGGPAQAPPTERIALHIPDGYTSHLENPQAMQDSTGTIFAATRPNSGVGGLVWKQTPDGSVSIVLPIDPDQMYALGEFQLWPDGYLRYVTVEKEDHTKLVVIPVPGWTP